MIQQHIGQAVQKPSGLAIIPWALFGNVDDSVDGPSNWRPDLKDGSFKRRALWWFRNPFHNLTFYVIGFRHLNSTSDQNIGSDYPGWLFVKSYVSGYKIPRYLIGHNGLAYQWYIGWRAGGAFGIKFRKQSAG
jgi:hypothetical protein